MEKHNTISFEEHTIHYRDEGRENPYTVVLLHGFLQNLNVWSSYTLSYMRDLRVITIDLPGHGYSDCYADTHTMDFMAKCVKAVLTKVGVSNCVMVGHSMGGYVALSFATQFPYMLKGLGLINSHIFADNEAKKQQRRNACIQVGTNRPSYVVDFIPNLFDHSCQNTLAHYIKDLQDQSLEMSAQGITAAQKGMMCRPDYLDTLRKLNCPVLFVHGKNDKRIPIELAAAQAMEAQRAELLLLENVGHMAHLEEREYVKLRLKNFVTSCYLLG